MADIGATLREARMRQRIDITDMEVETKIRAKYLRALENEEWDALPGPAYVKSFLRTYADALDLDGRRMVEEYKVRHERPSDADLHPIRPTGTRDRRRRERRGVPRWALIGVVLAGIFGALFALGQSADDGDDPAAVTTMPRTTGADGGADGERETARERRARRERAAERRRRAAARRTVSLRLIPTGPVSVCLVDARGRVLVRNQILAPGSPTRLFRSRSFRMVVGNNAVRLRIAGRDRTLPASSEAIARRVTAGRRLLPLAADDRPTCA